MSTVTSQAYNTEALLLGKVITRDDAPLAADTYYRGMPLAYDSGTGNYDYDAANIEAVYLGPDARVMSSAGSATIVVFGELQAGGIVDDSGDALTITEAIKQTAYSNGIYLK